MTARLIMTGPHPSLCGLPLYALINAYAGEPSLLGAAIYASSFDELRAKRAEAWGGRPIELAESDQPANDPLRLPYLVALEGPQDPLYAQLLEFAGQEAAAAAESGKGVFTMGAFIETALPAQRLMLRLQEMWKGRVYGGKPYLQVADPRGFEMLAGLLGADVVAKWLGPIARWHVRQRDGHWASHLGLADESLIDAEEDFFRRTERLARFEQTPAHAPIDFMQYRRLERYSVVVSKALTAAQAYTGHLPTHAHATAWEALDHALGRRISHPGDLQAYVWRAVVSPGPAFATAAQACLAAAALDPGSLDDRLAALATSPTQQALDTTTTRGIDRAEGERS